MPYTWDYDIPPTTNPIPLRLERPRCPEPLTGAMYTHRSHPVPTQITVAVRPGGRGGSWLVKSFYHEQYDIDRGQPGTFDERMFSASSMVPIIDQEALNA